MDPSVQFCVQYSATKVVLLRTRRLQSGRPRMGGHICHRTWCPAVCPVLLLALASSPWSTNKLRSTSTFPSITALQSRRCSSNADGTLREIVVVGSSGRWTSARNTSSGLLLKRRSRRGFIRQSWAFFAPLHRRLAQKIGPAYLSLLFTAHAMAARSCNGLFAVVYHEHPV